MIEDPKPAASLTADRVKRGAAPGAVETAPRPDAEAALRREAREFVTVTAADRVGGAVPELGVGAEGFLNWRRAGVFGLIYLGALAAFAAVFDVLP